MSNKRYKKYEGHSSNKIHLVKKNCGSGFPRHVMKDFEGERCSMSRRMISKSQVASVSWHRRGGVGLKDSYVFGLINKYVGKPYEKLKKEFDEQVKLVCKNKLCYNDRLDWYFEDEKVPVYGRQKFYIDKGGNVRRCPLLSRSKLFSEKLTKEQKRYNEKVRIPDLGRCREFNKYMTSLFNPDLSCERNYDYTPKSRQPILLGEFYVKVMGVVKKLPVYTYKTEISLEYHDYCGRKYDYKKGKYVDILFEEATWSDSNDEGKKDKRRRMREEWIPVSSQDMPTFMYGQTVTVVLPNIAKERNKREISYCKNMIEKHPAEEVFRQEQINKLQERIDKMPDTEKYNLGYGRFCLFVKRKDFNEKK